MFGVAVSKRFELLSVQLVVFDEKILQFLQQTRLQVVQLSYVLASERVRRPRSSDHSFPNSLLYPSVLPGSRRSGGLSASSPRLRESPEAPICRADRHHRPTMME